MNCVKCNAEIPAGKNFCVECGEHLPEQPQVRKCAKCGAVIPDGKNFCIECGEHLPNEKTADRPKPRKCAKCGTVIPKGKNFCVECGCHEINTETASNAHEQISEQNTRVLDRFDSFILELHKNNNLGILAGAFAIVLDIIFQIAAKIIGLNLSRWMSWGIFIGIGLVIYSWLYWYASHKLETGKIEKIEENENLVINCTKCGAVIPNGKNFCVECGEHLPEQPQIRKCTKCGATIPNGKNFCVECGEHLPEQTQTRKCAKCGAVIPEGKNFCVECGERLPDEKTTAKPEPEPRKCKKCGSVIPASKNFCVECGEPVADNMETGKNTRIRRCSGAQCRTPIPEGSSVCPKCGLAYNEYIDRALCAAETPLAPDSMYAIAGIMVAVNAILFAVSEFLFPEICSFAYIAGICVVAIPVVIFFMSGSFGFRHQPKVVKLVFYAAFGIAALLSCVNFCWNSELQNKYRLFCALQKDNALGDFSSLQWRKDIVRKGTRTYDVVDGEHIFTFEIKDTSTGKEWKYIGMKANLANEKMRENAKKWSNAIEF